MKNKKILLFLLILLAAWLLLSNSIIGYLWNKIHNSIPEQINFIDFSNNRSFSIEAEIDYCFIQNEMLEVLSVSGWAYNSEQISQETDEKEIAIILKSAKQSYFIPCSTYLRHDTRQPDGFGTEVSLLELPDETYRIYLLCLENEESYGISATSWLVNVDHGNIDLCDYPSQQLEMDCKEAVTVTNMKYSPGISVSSDKIDLWGWACISDTITDTQEIIVSFSDHENNTYYYSSGSVERYDIVDYLGSENYIMSGFQATIPGEDLDQYNWTIGIYVKQNDKLYRAPKIFSYNAQNKTISWLNAE